MILSFADQDTENIFNGKAVRSFPNEIANVARRKLNQLHNAQILIEMASPPGNNLEKLEGDRKGQYSIRINNRYRICFHWICVEETPAEKELQSGGNAANVEIVDYH
jgi:toxin HigB-1